ncbi:hypothetical protein DBB_22080 [Desulfoluna spongiiphila]|nr:hypothetical protein DBB_22080 [Desulfoluna spongiiphila]
MVAGALAGDARRYNAKGPLHLGEAALISYEERIPEGKNFT